MTFSLIVLLWACSSVGLLAILTLLPLQHRHDEFSLTFVMGCILFCPIGFPASVVAAVFMYAIEFFGEAPNPTIWRRKE